MVPHVGSGQPALGTPDGPSVRHAGDREVTSRCRGGEAWATNRSPHRLLAGSGPGQGPLATGRHP
ncbi:hypothetical protein IEQ44_11010 [Nocardioides sp. Y6]|uniref:Uncharacterized protein n=1 Tax=Nocardioides malaquae TaxID=2773426 RepID=A0ABR9RVQ7_9ACTN|nr:hypothetical protein [Nocardioides malaquae]MBE7325185.1 hypothetical protein [Nocardioides malaquae]